MLDVALLRERPDEVRAMLRARAADPTQVDLLLALDERRRHTVSEGDSLRSQRNHMSRQVRDIQDPTERQQLIEAVGKLKVRLGELDREQEEIDRDHLALLLTFPNLLDARTPTGQSEHESPVLRTVGTARGGDPTVHWDLGPARGLVDFERGVRLAGSRYYVLRDDLALLQRSLIHYLLGHHRAHGYRELYLPFSVKEEALVQAGQLPKFKDNLYRDVEDDFWLVPTAEVPITAFHAGETLAELPLRYCAYTPCFRREKMSAGRDVRGMKRGHQFDKVELYALCAAEQADDCFEHMMATVEGALTALDLAYRVRALCSADIGFGARRTLDIEVWSGGLKEWLEVSSVSHCGDFQARRARIKHKSDGKKGAFVHTLNGSGFGIPRMMIALMENFQGADGVISVPLPLRPWVGKEVL
jgi:seryl-tRNA synthetase